ncbi:MAG: hypothetical protein IJV15_07960 [Lachnospiraceae bacterium]|nr:hypothetical protein [Lachnospiraceae bacterium]
MHICTKCGDKFSGEEIRELKSEHESFSMHPFICPDCYDRLQRVDLEDQFSILMNDADIPSGLDADTLGCCVI